MKPEVAKHHKAKTIISNSSLLIEDSIELFSMSPESIHDENHILEDELHRPL
jgi:hypothetical protein